MHHLQYGVIFVHVFFDMYKRGHKRVHTANAPAFKGMLHEGKRWHYSYPSVTNIGKLWQGSPWKMLCQQSGSRLWFSSSVSTKSCDTWVNQSESWRTYANQYNSSCAYSSIFNAITTTPNTCLTEVMLYPDCDKDWFQSLWKYHMGASLYFTY